MTPDQYCTEKAAPRGSTLHYALLFTPGEPRRAATAILAFRQEVAGVVSEVSDPGVARAKLEWWREEVSRTFAGNPQHPVTRALAPHLADRHLASEQFLEVVDGAELDLDHAEYASYRELGLYCHMVGGIVWMLAAEALGHRERQTLRAAQRLGSAMQLADLIGSVRDDARRGHVRLPADEMARMGVTRAMLYAPETSVPLRALLTVQLRRAQEQIQQALELLPDADRERQRPALVLAAIYRATLQEMERDGLRVLERQVALTPLRKLWITLATAWREGRRPPVRGGPEAAGQR
jgi:phytoene synthase